MDELLKWLQEQTKAAGRLDEIDSGKAYPDDFFGGNIDDAFFGGVSDGEVRMVDTIITKLAELGYNLKVDTNVHN